MQRRTALSLCRTQSPIVYRTSSSDTCSNCCSSLTWHSERDMLPSLQGLAAPKPQPGPKKHINPIFFYANSGVTSRSKSSAGRKAHTSLTLQLDAAGHKKVT